MNKYIGQPCTSCRSLIKEDEQVVVCPVCGSPYHKDCYAAEGKCINTDLHEKGESWQPEAPSREFFDKHPEAAPDHEDETVGIVCPRCGLTNQPGSVFCSQCGMPLNMEKATQARSFGFNPFSGMKREDPNLDGVQLSDYGNYVGSNQFYFLPKFLRFAKMNTKLSVNWSAFLFPDVYFFYRKMPILGVLIVLFSTVFAIPGVIITLQEMGISTMPVTDTLIVVNNILAVVLYVMRFLCGFFANRIYFNKARKDILKIKSTTQDEGEVTLHIRRKGGTNAVLAVLGLCLEMAISMIVTAVLMGGVL